VNITESDIRAFVARYEAASGTHDFSNVADLIHPNAMFRFRDGDFIGIDAIRAAFEKTWTSWDVKDERYYLTDVVIVHIDAGSASITYAFNWSGVVDGKSFSSSGRGTGVIVKNGANLQFIHEHLSN
jgi:ketosteroid isomerase-like protein